MVKTQEITMVVRCIWEKDVARGS